MKPLLCWALLIALSSTGICQVDTTFVYKTGMPYGTLDIRLAKSATRYYFLDPGKTISYRESSPGVRTNRFKDMTNWDSSPYTEGNLREQVDSRDYFIMNYRLLFPSNYNEDFSNGYPLIVMLHGVGERGNCWDTDCYHADRSWSYGSNNPPAPTSAEHPLLNNDHNLSHGGKPHLDARNLAGGKYPDDPNLHNRAFPGFVLFPQNMNGWSGSSVEDAIRLVRLVSKKYNVDPDRIYVHGLSNGAIAVYDAIKRAPWLFAAALPMSSPNDAGVISQGLVNHIAHIPLWIFQGGMDVAPRPSQTEGYVKTFLDAGMIVRYTKYDNLGHGVWNTAYKEPDFFSWMLEQRRSNLHVFAGVPRICNTNGKGVTLRMPDGFLKYQWEKDGQVLSASGAAYTANTTGVYRGRFSRVQNPGSSDWNEWSEAVSVGTQTPVKPTITQVGSVVLRDLNGSNDVRLVADGDFAHYYWYKNGTKVSLKDTTKHAVFKPGTCTSTCTNNGHYTLVVSGHDGCPSAASEPKVLYFSYTAPVNLTSPANFQGHTVSASGVNVSWTDASSGELGFEIWKRKVNPGGGYSKWSMSTLTRANATSYLDEGLEPSSTYQYKIRAVSESGRSDYTPANSYLILHTGEDSTPPQAPTTLRAQQTGVGKISVEWTAASDNTGIREYIVYYSHGGNTTSVPTGSVATTFTLEGLPVNRTYRIWVRAEDLGGNVGAGSGTVSANTYVSGLYYEHSTGAWTDLDAIDWNMVEYSGKTSNFNINVKVQDDYFNLRFEGYLYVRTGGTYYFSTSSNEGSRLELGGRTIVDNDGIHGTRTITSNAQTLSAGARPIVVKYFENQGGEIIRVSYKGPDTDGEWMYIPDTALRSSATSSASSEEAVLVAEPMAIDDPIVLYPNPTDQQNIRVRVADAEDEPVQVRLIDLKGRVMHQQRFEGSAIRDGVQLEPGQPLQDGMYVLFLQDTRGTRQRMLAIKRN